jgi:AraC-like DNA-binding protein
VKSHRAGPTPGNFASRPPVGQLFNPCCEICGFYAPDIVARQTDLTDGQKRLYERGVRWVGTNGAFWYSFEAMATELGKSPRQVKRDMAGLERARPDTA